MVRDDAADAELLVRPAHSNGGGQIIDCDLLPLHVQIDAVVNERLDLLIRDDGDEQLVWHEPLQVYRLLEGEPVDLLAEACRIIHGFKYDFFAILPLVAPIHARGRGSEEATLGADARLVEHYALCALFLVRLADGTGDAVRFVGYD